MTARTNLVAGKCKFFCAINFEFQLLFCAKHIPRANRAKPVMKAADNVPGECPLCPVEPLPNNQSENDNNGLSFDLYPFVLCFYLSSRSNRAQNRRKRLWNRSAEPFFSFPSYKVVSGNFINLNYCVT